MNDPRRRRLNRSTPVCFPLVALHSGKAIHKGEIVPMTRGDLDEVLAIERVSFPRPWLRGFFESELKNPLASLFVEKIKEEGRETVGAYIVFWIMQDEAHILNIAVRPDLRRMGLAKRLLRFSLGLMKEKGVREAYLEVRRSNEPARCLYRGFGFEELFIREKYYGDEDAIVMRLIFSDYLEDEEGKDFI